MHSLKSDKNDMDQKNHEVMGKLKMSDYGKKPPTTILGLICAEDSMAVAITWILSIKRAS